MTTSLLLTLWLMQPPSDPAPVPAPESVPALDPGSEPRPEPLPEPQPEGPQPASESEGPPYYSEADMARLRERWSLPAEQPIEAITPNKPKWRCLIADPSCGFGVELLATSAYTYRMRQGDLAEADQVFRWHSARAAYELWINFPAHTQTLGTYKFTRFTLGPKAGIVTGDNRDLWGNIGIAGRYWFGRGAWSPALEFSSALSFRLTRERNDQIVPQRSPIGITADVGINVGGWGAIIFGAQYDSPLAREDLAEKVRISAAGQVFVGFRGNILWGVPAAAAVGTHVASQRAIGNQP